ncbi:protein-tyrosine phosphatase [Seinonella peptonophila]|uniref:Protein-tyrosine phosphatase n=1 Tax=Seinonella peptonophila TaxID=112248 RepID=A0A1M4XV27_9BACL|nr:low molecular weight protein arginine phosphatase [Seinonella peptonophila]SHE97280.1 protein-tyrosine phosphatase [Seinonella peptonophila]
MKKILFVCTGNTCRSPMAEALLRQIAHEEGLEIETRSAGIAALDGGTISSHAISVLQEKGIKYTGQSQMIDLDILHWADLVITMTTNHKQILFQFAPEKIEQMITLKELAYHHSDAASIEQKLDKIYQQVEEKRLAIQSEFQIESEEKWPEEAEERWKKELSPLLEEEKQLRKKLDQVNLNADIQDPFGGSLEEYRACRDEIEAELRQWISQLKNEK